ncbi:MAG: Ig-like domain-containing protein [Clostridia bacterium]|jgi:hypothetical protein|nr:Ig-like domain-containing protein [Clostridia bacterium]
MKKILIILAVVLSIFSIYKLVSKEDYEDVNIISAENNQLEFKYNSYDDTTLLGKKDGFEIKLSKKYSKEELIEKIKIDPEMNIDITLEEGKAIIKPEDKWYPDTAFIVELEDKTFAFQTNKFLDVTWTNLRGVEELPINAGVEISFNREINKENIKFEIEPKVECKYETNYEKLIIYPVKNFDKNTKYKLTIKAGITDKDKERKLLEDHIINFKTGSETTNEKDLNLSLINLHYGYNFTEKEIPYILFYSWKYEKQDVDNVDIETYKIDDINNFISYMRNNEEYKYGEFVENKKPLTKFTAELMEVSSSEYGVSFPETMEKGIYIVKAKVNHEVKYLMMQVSNIAAYSMKSEKDDITWVVDTKTKKPINGAVLNTVNNKNYISDENGIIISKEEIDEDKWKLFEYIKHGDDIFFMNMHRIHDDFYYRGIDNESTLYGSLDYYSYIYMDRKIYLPNDEVNIWGMIKSKNKDKLKDKTFKLVIAKDWYEKDNAEFIKDFTLNDNNTFENTIKLSGLETGYYSVFIYLDDTKIVRDWIKVDEFKTKEAKIKINKYNKNIYAWDKVDTSINLLYLNENPIRDKKVWYYENYNNKIEQYTDVNGQVKIEKEGMFNKNNSSIDYVVGRRWIGIRASINKGVQLYKDISYNVFYKDEMITAKKNRKSDTEYSFEVETNKVNISKLEDKDYVQVEDYRGKEIDKEVDIKVVEIIYKKIVSGTYYDFKDKVKKEKYDYKREEKIEYKKRMNTKAGKLKFDYEFKPNTSYRVEVSTYANKGGIVRETLNLDTYKDSYARFDYYLNKYRENSIGIEQDNYKFKINEQAEVKYSNVSKVLGDKFLYIYMQDGIFKYEIKDELITKFKYEKEYKPNIFIKVVQLVNNGFKKSSKNIILRYDYSDHELDVETKTLKAIYKPGDNVTLYVNVADKEGKAKNNAAVNISIVDEAVFNVMDSSANILDDIYARYYGSGATYEYVKQEARSDMTGGAEGGEGAENEGNLLSRARNNFKNTALFISGETNKEGMFKTTFKLPDNLTSWRVTTQAVTDEVKAGDDEININTRLNFDVGIEITDFITNKDDISVLAKFGGYSFNETKNVEYKLYVLDSNEKEILAKIGSAKGSNENIKIGKLEIGKYKILLTAKQGEFEDTLVKSLYVNENNFMATMTDYYEPTKKDSQFNHKGINRYVVINNNTYLSYALNIAYLNNNRLDTAVAKKYVRVLLNEISGEDLFDYEEVSLNDYRHKDGGIAPLRYSSPEAEITANTILALNENNYLDRKYLRKVIDESTNEDEVVSAYMGLAAMKKPVLGELKAILNIEDISLESRMKAIIGLIKLGDISLAKEEYEKLRMTNYKVASNKMAYYETLEATSYALIVESYLEYKDAYKLYNFLSSNYSKYDDFLMQKLIFIKKAVSNEDNRELKIKIRIGENEKELSLQTNECYVIKAEDEQVKLYNATKDYSVNHIYRKDIELEKIDSDYVKVTKTIENKGNIKQGDIVKVNIKVEFNEDTPKGSYLLTDSVPTGLSDPFLNSYYLSNYNRMIDTNFYYDKDSKWEFANKKERTFTYEAEAINEGEFYVNRALIRAASSDIKATTEDGVIEVK